MATPLEQQINGVENMLYMSSQSTGDGRLTVTVTFRIGTDLNVAQMLTQNRVQDALPRLPEDVSAPGRSRSESRRRAFSWLSISYSPRQHARHALSVELRDVAREGHASASAAVSATCSSGCARVRDAYLDRPRQGRRATI